MKNETKNGVLFATLDIGKETDFVMLNDKTIMMINEKRELEIPSSDLLSYMGYFVTDAWSTTSYAYTIKENVENAYSEIDETIPVYVCEYFVECNDMVSMTVYGFGNTPIEALTDCQNYIEILKSYNTEIDDEE